MLRRPWRSRSFFTAFFLHATAGTGATRCSGRHLRQRRGLRPPRISPRLSRLLIGDLWLGLGTGTSVWASEWRLWGVRGEHPGPYDKPDGKPNLRLLRSP